MKSNRSRIKDERVPCSESVEEKERPKLDKKPQKAKRILRIFSPFHRVGFIYTSFRIKD